jgi:2-isopropylmalate synthase
MADKIIIFDTTLRDGEQIPGASLTRFEKLEIAKQLEKLNVDVIEAGFPISSPGDLESVKEIARAVRKPVIAGLCRAVKKDIDACREALKPAKKGRIHTFIGTSDIHIKFITNTTREEVLRRSIEAVKLARNYSADVEFSAMDAARTDFDYLCKIVEETIKAGASTINIPDSVGYSEPVEHGKLIRDLMNNVPNINKAIIAVHCHNDLGMATANSLSAVMNGARQIECTINGLGERAGNAALEEVVMALRVRKDVYNLETNIKTEEIYKTSKLVSRYTGIPVQPNKAIIGQNAFSHASGIHQDAILKKESTFGIMTPKSIGITGHELVLTSRSGRHALSHRLSALGFAVEGEELNAIYVKFLAIADKKKEVFDEDLQALMETEGKKGFEACYSLEEIYVATGNKITPTATVKIRIKSKSFEAVAMGDGPVDATYKAINSLVKEEVTLLDYQLRSITGGKEALGEVSVRIKKGAIEVNGRGLSTDVIEASARAYLDALSKLERAKHADGANKKKKGCG